MHIPIEDIKVKKRIRKDLGDIKALAQSMKRLGQITPIVISKNNLLVAGERRLEAARSLGWRTINVVVTEIPDELAMLEIEMEENNQRLSFTREEAENAAMQLHRLQNPSMMRRIFGAIARFFKRIFRREDRGL